MTHSAVLTSLVALAVCTLGGCRSSDQPASKPTPPANENTTTGSAASHAAADKAHAANSTNKDAKLMTTVSAASPLITKSHTLTKFGKELTEAGKLPTTLQAATFGAGCFWGVESTFRKLPGIVATSVGFSGGRKAAPSYKEVCYNETGHAEVVDVVFDPAAITYAELLNTFFSNHNPTTLNRQGPDEGTQYRSVVFARSDEQMAAATAAKDALAKSGKWSQPIVTQIVKFEHFWPAEEYHQTYLEKKGLDVCH